MNSDFLSSLSEERRHNLTATEAELDRERDARIVAFAKKFPDLYEQISVAVSAGIVREVMRTTKREIREWRQFEVAAVEPIHYSKRFIWDEKKIKTADGQECSKFTRRICKDEEQTPAPHHERVVLRDTETGKEWLIIVTNELAPIIYDIEDYRSMIERTVFFYYFENDWKYQFAKDAIGDVLILPTINGEPHFPEVTREAIKQFRKDFQDREVRS